MAILLTNDDGIYSEGLIALVNALRDLDEVVVVAPDSERSSIGHAITLRRPLRINKLCIDIGGCKNVYTCDGTPVDCVILGVSEVLKGKEVRAIISGINKGLNLGIDIVYSGTVAAAMEGALLGITSVAISADSTNLEVFKDAASFVRSFLPKLLEKGLPQHTFLNINFPKNPRGVRITKQGYRVYSGRVLKYEDPWGEKCYWISGDVIERLEYDSDIWAVSNGYISVTPLHVDLTNYECLGSLREWYL